MNHYIHNLDPIAFTFLEIPFPWYWLSYFIGYFWVLFFISYLIKKSLIQYDFKTYLNMLFPGFLLMLISGKLFYILFYNFSYYLSNPKDILAIWQGGMSFHGALLGGGAWMFFYAKRYNLNFWKIADPICMAVSFNLIFGRVANFINGELAGRVTDVPWAVVFPRFYNQSPRHPSQLYEAFLEGLVLFIILFCMRRELKKTPAFISGAFLFGYGFFRFIIEFFRMPDIQLGYFLGIFTIGQLYCLVMVIIGLLIIRSSKLRP